MKTNNKNNSIRNWAEDDRPREKLSIKGVNALSNAELLAIIIGSGSKNKSALELAKEILVDNNNNFTGISRLELSDLTKYKGIGQAKAINIIAALEIGKRNLAEKASKKIKVKNSKEVFQYFYPVLAGKTSEEFWILLLDRANNVIGKYQISIGGFTGTIADPKKIFRIALEKRATALVLCHNHPSNNLQPSESDNNLTKKLKDAGNSLEISVLDHIIIGINNYFSYSDEGLL